MSFGDINISSGVKYGQGQSSITAPKSTDPIKQISDSLQSFQRTCLTLKDKITEYRRRKVSPAEKNDLDKQLRELRDMDQKLKNSLDRYQKQLEATPKGELMAQKASVGKLVKDFEKVRTIVPSLSSSASLVKVSTETDNGPDTFQRIIPGESNAGATRSGKDKFSGQQQQQLMVQSVLSGQEIDDAIVAERERDIKKLNQDLAAVNELFKDMAVIVEKQNEQIVEIAVATETSHDQAKAGLEQVKKAAQYQPGCTIC